MSPVSIDRLDAIAIISVDNPPVNALSQAVREGLLRCVDEAVDDADVEVIVIICAGRTFIAGADITEFGKPLRPPDFLETMEIIESLSKPAIAAIHGTALGGGLETALCCHYRVAVPSARVGLPEVTLGLLPGGGGTQRLPRLVGAEAALPLVVGGSPIRSQREAKSSSRSS